jgi:uncharacterized protein (UPF0276 family)
MRELGVGLVYWSALDPILSSPGSTVSVLELEPQALWEKTCSPAGWRYRGNEGLLEHIASLPQAKLLHGVAHPVGGTVRDPVAHLPLLEQAVRRLDPAWVSEHLSFNRVQGPVEVEHAGFLLPPPQSLAAARVATHNLNQFRNAIDRPVAFETGVNYLRRQNGELDDGDFFAAVAEGADSGILLDLHNLWCNQRNGRQNVAEALARLPLERVWELHLAGGMQESGYWLDAHSGAVPPEVMDIASDLIPRLPNLGALIFEVLPEHLPRFGLDAVQRQIEALQALWRRRGPRLVRAQPRASSRGAPPTAADIAEVAHWERELVGALRAPATAFATSAGLRDDPGCALLRMLVGEFRRANLARTLHYTMTALLSGLGAPGTHHLLDAYFETRSPEPFAAVEADRFAQFLRARMPLRPAIPFLDEVLAFEHALVRATVYGASSELAWSADPIRMFDALDAGTLPRGLPQVFSTMLICAAESAAEGPTR